MLTNRNIPLTPQTDVAGRVLTFDFPAFQIGVAEYAEGPTGCTVFYFPQGAATAIDKRGGAVGTIGDYPWNHAIILAGGSLYGLEAAAGVAAELNARHHYQIDRMALISGAVINDLGGKIDNRIYPDMALGQAALLAAQSGIFPLGARGAGRWACCGAIFGGERVEASGQGGAFRQIGQTKIAAFVVVNAVGVILDRQGQVILGNRDPQTGERRHPIQEYEARIASGQVTSSPDGNTTLSVIVTNQQMTNRELEQWGKQVHTSMSQAIQPFQTLKDGDTLFAVTTNEVTNPSLEVAALGVLTAELVWDAILTIPEEIG